MNSRTSGGKVTNFAKKEFECCKNRLTKEVIKGII